jgi:hypothetical protein
MSIIFVALCCILLHFPDSGFQIWRLRGFTPFKLSRFLAQSGPGPEWWWFALGLLSLQQGPRPHDMFAPLSRYQENSRKFKKIQAIPRIQEVHHSEVNMLHHFSSCFITLQFPDSKNQQSET